MKVKEKVGAGKSFEIQAPVRCNKDAASITPSYEYRTYSYFCKVPDLRKLESRSVNGKMFLADCGQSLH